MANIFEITPAIREVARKAFDDLIDQLSKTCRLYYPPIMEPCSNCLPDPIGKKSANRWLDGGPAPFPLGSVCPMCGGEGYRANQLYDDVQLLVSENAKKFYFFGKIEIPDGSIETKFYIHDLPKVVKCDYMLLDLPNSQSLRKTYRLVGEPAIPGNIIQGRYVIALWQRIN
jgi:hypothetical protein